MVRMVTFCMVKGNTLHCKTLPFVMCSVMYCVSMFYLRFLCGGVSLAESSASFVPDFMGKHTFLFIKALFSRIFSKFAGRKEQVLVQTQQCKVICT